MSYLASDSPETENYDVELGPLFTFGMVLIVLGFFRRRAFMVAAGIGAVWLDQRTDLGRRLKGRIRSAAKTQINARARD